MSLPETIANLVLDRLGISMPDDLLFIDEIVYARGALLRECPMEGAEARLLLGPGRPIIAVSSSPFVHHRRRRFSIAHELGHFEIQRGISLLRSCSNIDIQDKPDNAKVEVEQEANQFASALLIPARFVQEPFASQEPSFEVISEWAEKLETSLTATAFRFTYFTPEPIAVVYSVHGTIQYFQPSSEFTGLGVFPDVKGPVGSYTGARALFSGRNAPYKWNEVRASEWFRKNINAFDREDIIREWSIAMPSHDAVLSLLWVHEPLGQNNDW